MRKTIEIPRDYRVKVRRVIFRGEPNYARRVILVRGGIVTVKYGDGTIRREPIGNVIDVF
ncbi:hypothetical protein [Novipirellula galeiformis]|uniref:hypothetical protein n=1 Tax=Novipirellula galeiformis TaxID=2528004 RepID=UPI0011B76BCC|nr:hypothetical protein [Novipirellula galeiformis]